MSGPYQQPPPPDRQGSFPGSPLSPTPTNGSAPSFKTNVNRTKTKRWVEAKSYSYDGGDWGDDDEYEEEEEETPAPPVPAIPPIAANDAHSQSTSAHGSSQGERSLSRDSPALGDGRSGNPSKLTSDKSAGASGTPEPVAPRPPAFIRPADIYKRMQEERERERRSHETSRSESDSVGPTPQAADAVPRPYPSPRNRDQGPSSPPDRTSTPSQAVSPLALPEVKRLPGFASGFMSDANPSSKQKQPTEDAQEPTLQHIPSLGFRSAVNQAFDVPDTPSTVVDSVGRSNSDSTSVISPIMSNRLADVDKTPTITEEPAEAAAEAPGQEGTPGFQPGYRRDLTVPNPGNGPDRLPEVSTAEGLPQSALAETSSISPWQSRKTLDERAAENEPAESDKATASQVPTETTLQETGRGDELQVDKSVGADQPETQHPFQEERSQAGTALHAPAPLQIPAEEQPPQQPSSAGTVPEIVPSMSTETSPQDMESDRLRKEIIRSLSPDSPRTGSTQLPPSEHLEPKSRPRYESTYLPTEYDSYWNEEPEIAPTSPLQPKPPVPSTEPLTLTINPKPSNEAKPDGPDAESRPRLKKRFSWEESDDSEIDILEDPSQPFGSVAPAQPSEQPQAENKEAPPHLELVQSEPTSARSSGQIQPQLSAGVPDHESSMEKETSQSQPALEESQRSSGILPVSQSQNLQPSGRPNSDPRLPGFRQIMEIQSPNERIRVFNETREQFAAIDSGLSDWIRSTADALSEHADLVQLNGRLPGGAPKPLPPKNKFPKLSSLGNLALPSSLQEGSSQPASPGHVRRASGTPLGGFESKGKDLLHTAGVLGGKAGGAARGLFAKGKSKLRGADKGSLSIFGHRRSMTLDDDPKTSKLDQEKPTSNPSQRLSVQVQPVPRIPSFKFHERPFSGVFDDADMFSPDKPDHSRMSSQGHGADEQQRSLKAVPEESYSFSTSSSITRRMLQSEGATEDNASSLRHQQSVGPYSTDSNSSDADVTDTKTIDGEAYKLERHSNQPERTIGAYPAEARDGHKETKVNEQAVGSSPPDRRDHDFPHEVSSSAVAGAGQPSVEKSSSQTHSETAQEPNLESSDVRESRVYNTGEHSPPLLAAVETPRAPTPAERKERSSLRPDIADIADPQVLRSNPEPSEPEPGVPPNSKFEDHGNISQPLSTEDRKQELKAPSQMFEERNQTPRPLSMGNLRVSPLRPQRTRRLSSTSQISAIAQEEMDAIRDRLREAADSTPKSNQVSEIGEEEINVLNRELDEAGHQSNREAAESKQSNGLEESHVPDERSLVDTSTERRNRDSQRPRFSFESERNSNVEGRAEEREMRGSDHEEVDGPPLVAQSSQLADIADEHPSDEPPPPFDEPNADYLEDKKEDAENAPSYDSSAPSQHPGAQGLGISTVPHPSPQGPPIHQPIRALATNQYDPSRRKILPQSHADASPVPSVLRPGGGANRFYSSQLQGPPSRPRQGPPREQPVRSPAVQQSQARAEPQFSPTITDPAGRGTSHDGGISPDQDTTPTRNSFLVRRPHSGSQGSGDSMLANAGTSHLDLRPEPSPLNQHTESPSPNTQPLKSKIKMIGKLHRMSAPVMDTSPPDGKKKTFALISGFFKPSPNKPEGAGGRQQVPQQNRPRHPHQAASWHGTDSQPGYHRNSPPVSKGGSPFQQFKPSPVIYGPFSGQPPPPQGYYAPTQSYSPQGPNSPGAYGQQPSIPGQGPPQNSDVHYPGPPAVPPPQLQYQYPVQAPYQQPYPSPSVTSNGHSSPSLHSTHSPSGTLAAQWSSRGATPSPERGRSRAEELHLRSRSPRTVVTPTGQWKAPGTDYSDPAHRLGQFNAMPVTPRIGDQQRPWNISLPEDPEGGNSRRPSFQPLQHARPAPGISASGYETPSSTLNRAINLKTGSQPSHPFGGPITPKPTAPVELPATADNKSEEIVMSSTAYPGQEWQPDGYEQWMPY